MHFQPRFKIIPIIWIISASSLSNGIETMADGIQDISYRELEDMGASCSPLDNCKKRHGDALDENNCNCDSTCTEFDTCCLDSEHRVTGIPKALNSEIKCRPIYRSRYGVYMIDKCQNGDSTTERLCASNGEDVNDPFLMIPATSLATKITYKNYFCLVCNEDADKDQVVLWDLELQSTSKEVDGSTVPHLKFDNTARSWMIDDNGTSHAATVSIHKTSSVSSFVKMCKAGVKGLISNCSEDWTDESIVQKCAAYMATVGINGDEGMKWYRNPHCALCNHEDVRRRFCKQPDLGTRGWSYADTFFVRTFRLEDEETSCGRKMIFDHFFKKCRCDSRESIMQDGKCLSIIT